MLKVHEKYTPIHWLAYGFGVSDTDTMMPYSAILKTFYLSVSQITVSFSMGLVKFIHFKFDVYGGMGRRKYPQHGHGLSAVTALTACNPHH